MRMPLPGMAITTTQLARVALLLMAACVKATPVSADKLFERGGTCAAANFSRCPQTVFPDFFCCPSSQTCVALAGNTTVLCCPSGQDCSRIKPISCDVTQQNGTAHPDAVIKTTALTSVLGRCGSGTCCPFGYSCDSEGLCVMNSDQNPAPFETTPTSPTTTASGGASSSAAGSPKTTTGAPAGSTGSGTAESASETSDAGTGAAQQSSSGPSTAVIAGAVIGAVLVAIAVGFVTYIFLRKQKQKRESADGLKLTRSSSSFGNIISNPIITESSTLRTDFNRKLESPGRPGTGSTSFGGRGPSINSSEDWPRTPSPTRTRDGNAPRIPPIRAMRQSSIAYGYGYPETPRSQREPSSVSINIFADPRTMGTPETRRNSGLTTFTSMMEEADLGPVARGAPYVPGSTNTSPERRRR